MSLLKILGVGKKSTPSKSEKELIEEIHNEFDTAPDRLLAKALEVINKESEAKIVLESEVEDTAERLKKIGFVKTPMVSKLQSIKEHNKEKDKIIEMEQEEANTIKYYADTYPFLKFLTEIELDRICDKYGLIYAPVAHYKETVPAKNLRDIEEAQSLKSKDTIKNFFKLKVISGIKENLSNKNIEKHLKEGTYFEARTSSGVPAPSQFYPKDYWRKYEEIWSKDFSEKYKEEERLKLPNPENIRFFHYISESNILSCGKTIWEKARRDREIELNALRDEYKNAEFYLKDRWNNDRKFEISKQEREGLFIAAPKSHFDLTGLEKDGKGYYKTQKQSIVQKDPIVFRYVQGGIQVLTKWGLEAEDPALQIDILN